jgi:hypothetical protein
MNSNYKNKTEIIRSTKDATHPFTVLSSAMLKWNGYQRAIAWELLSNSSDFIINKSVVEKRLQFPRKKFNDAWASLEELGFITKKAFVGGVKWTVTEPESYIETKNEAEVTLSTGSLSTGGKTTNTSLFGINGVGIDVKNEAEVTLSTRRLSTGRLSTGGELTSTKRINNNIINNNLLPTTKGDIFNFFDNNEELTLSKESLLKESTFKINKERLERMDSPYERVE